MRSLRRVFALAPDCHVSAGYYRVLWRRHFYEGLEASVERLWIPMGISYDWARWQGAQDATRDLSSGRGECSERIWHQIRDAHRNGGLDAVISYCFSRDIDPELVRNTVKLGVPWINFFCDSLHMFEQVRELAGEVSLNWFPESAAVARYEQLGRRTICRPYALNAAWLPAVRPASGARGVGFIGFPSANRITQLGFFRLFGCKVNIRGRGWVGPAQDPFYSSKSVWQRLFAALATRGWGEKVIRRLMWRLVRSQAGGELADEEFFEFLAGTLVSLGLNQGRDEQGRLVSYMKMRDLEFPGYGCCYLTEHNEDVAAAFESGREILLFRSCREGAALVREMERDPDRSRLIGQAGRRRVLSDHTWSRRLEELAQRL